MALDYFLFGYRHGDTIRPGLQKGTDLYALDANLVPSLEALLADVAADDLIALLDSAVTEPLPADTAVTLRGLLTTQPVWAAGVTYKKSEEARERESDNSTVYMRVYSATRPELFWKAMGSEIASSGDKVGIRADATWSIPEPELTVVINARKEVVGFTIGNDMSSRDIEGENPLYLPQAKVYDDACALGPRIWLRPNSADWGDLDIRLEITRAGEVQFSGATSTAQLKREVNELRDYLFRAKGFPTGVFLLTGTGVVPHDEFTLAAGDQVRITIPPIGELINTVHVVG